MNREPLSFGERLVLSFIGFLLACGLVVLVSVVVIIASLAVALARWVA